jgi:hypothetical protein
MITFDYLLPKTKQVLIELAKSETMEDYTFVGGSALSCYLSHRLSEDLDFFTWNNSVDAEKLLPIFDRDYLKIINLSAQQTDLLYKGVKVTFFSNKWNELRTSRAPLISHINIASLDLLAAMKVNTLFLRAKFRDYYDLYCLVNQYYNIVELYKLSLNLLPGMTKRLFQIAFTFTDDIIDDDISHLSPNQSVSKKEIEVFFLKKIKEWNKNIA